jgi:hypothetical protein
MAPPDSCKLCASLDEKSWHGYCCDTIMKELSCASWSILPCPARRVLSDSTYCEKRCLAEERRKEDSFAPVLGAELKGFLGSSGVELEESEACGSSTIAWFNL